MNKAVNRNGMLKNEFLPAIYFDTSFIVDYWIVEGVENLDPSEENIFQDDLFHGPVTKVVQDLLRSETRINKVAGIRRKILLEDTSITPVTSHFALWEFQEWYAESGFKQLGAEISGAYFLQKKGKKEIGSLLKKAYELWEAEGDEHHHPKTGTSGLESLRQSTMINLSFAYSHGLSGILVAEVENFCWPPKRSQTRNPFVDPYSLAYLQLGMADSLHLLIANHLGCQYFASFDSDFRTARRFIEDTGMELLTSPEEIHSVL